MTKFTKLKARLEGGFTLVELMTVVVVIAILTAVAVPSYNNQVRKSRPTEAKSMLMDLSAREERYLATNGTYTSSAPALGLTTYPQTTSSGYYSIAAPTITAATAGSATAAATPGTFSFTATAASTQVQDKECNTFTLTNAGVQTSKNSGGGATTDCW